MEPETILLLSLVAFLFSLDVYLLKKYRALSAAKRSATGITGGHLNALKKGIHEQLQEPEAEEVPSAVKPQEVIEAAERPATPVPTKAAPKRRKRRPKVR